MNDKEKSFLNRATGLMKDIKDYILSNNDWVYYFINPLVESEVNKPLKDIVEQYPDEWEDYVDIEIEDFNGTSVKIMITVDDYSETPPCLHRFIYLPHFSETVERNKKLYSAKFNEIKVANLIIFFIVLFSYQITL